jgi:hypothetical protein
LLDGKFGDNIPEQLRRCRESADDRLPPFEDLNRPARSLAAWCAGPLGAIYLAADSGWIGLALLPGISRFGAVLPK